MYDEYGALRVSSGKSKIRFGRVEIMHMVIAVLALTLAFTVVYLQSYGLWGSLPAIVELFAVSGIAVATGFLLHELMHKFVAQRYGAWAEFRIFPFGLLMAVVFSFLGFVFAAPGAVYIQGRLTRRQNGLISLAGPGVNLIIGGSALAAWYLLPESGIVSFVLYFVGSVNALLALFNLLPIPPLDGSKVLSWNIPIYIAALAASAVMFAVSFRLI